MMKHNFDPHDAISETLQKIEDAALRAEELTRQFLTFSKGGQPEKRDASIKRIIQQASERAFNYVDNLMAGKGKEKPEFELFINITPDLPPFQCDWEQITQCMGNLLVNAVEALREKGTIIVDVETAAVTPDDVPELPKGDYIKVSVTDSGTGIEKENLFKVFDPYFSTKTRVSQKGLGLGLSIVYSIIKKHGGHVELYSEIDIGTTVMLYLPVKPEEPKEETV
jgi:signal transduction histidine kinase